MSADYHADPLPSRLSANVGPMLSAVPAHVRVSSPSSASPTRLDAFKDKLGPQLTVLTSPGSSPPSSFKERLNFEPLLPQSSYSKEPSPASILKGGYSSRKLEHTSSLKSCKSEVTFSTQVHELGSEIMSKVNIRHGRASGVDIKRQIFERSYDPIETFPTFSPRSTSRSARQSDTGSVRSVKSSTSIPPLRVARSFSAAAQQAIQDVDAGDTKPVRGAWAQSAARSIQRSATMDQTHLGSTRASSRHKGPRRQSTIGMGQLSRLVGRMELGKGSSTQSVSSPRSPLVHSSSTTQISKASYYEEEPTPFLSAWFTQADSKSSSSRKHKAPRITADASGPWMSPRLLEERRQQLTYGLEEALMSPLLEISRVSGAARAADQRSAVSKLVEVSSTWSSDDIEMLAQRGLFKHVASLLEEPCMQLGACLLLIQCTSRAPSITWSYAEQATVRIPMVLITSQADNSPDTMPEHSIAHGIAAFQLIEQMARSHDGRAAIMGSKKLLQDIEHAVMGRSPGEIPLSAAKALHGLLSDMKTSLLVCRTGLPDAICTRFLQLSCSQLSQGTKPIPTKSKSKFLSLECWGRLSMSPLGVTSFLLVLIRCMCQLCNISTFAYRMVREHKVLPPLISLVPLIALQGSNPAGSLVVQASTEAVRKSFPHLDLTEANKSALGFSALRCLAAFAGVPGSEARTSLKNALDDGSTESTATINTLINILRDPLASTSSCTSAATLLWMASTGNDSFMDRLIRRPLQVIPLLVEKLQDVCVRSAQSSDGSIVDPVHMPEVDAGEDEVTKQTLSMFSGTTETRSTGVYPERTADNIVSGTTETRSTGVYPEPTAGTHPRRSMPTNGLDPGGLDPNQDASHSPAQGTGTAHAASADGNWLVGKLSAPFHSTSQSGKPVGMVEGAILEDPVLEDPILEDPSFGEEMHPSGKHDLENYRNDSVLSLEIFAQEVGGIEEGKEEEGTKDEEPASAVLASVQSLGAALGVPEACDSPRPLDLSPPPQLDLCRPMQPQNRSSSVSYKVVTKSQVQGLQATLLGLLGILAIRPSSVKEFQECSMGKVLTSITPALLSTSPEMLHQSVACLAAMTSPRQQACLSPPPPPPGGAGGGGNCDSMDTAVAMSSRIYVKVHMIQLASNMCLHAELAEVVASSGTLSLALQVVRAAWEVRNWDSDKLITPAPSQVITPAASCLANFFKVTPPPDENDTTEAISDANTPEGGAETISGQEHLDSKEALDVLCGLLCGVHHLEERQSTQTRQHVSEDCYEARALASAVGFIAPHVTSQPSGSPYPQVYERACLRLIELLSKAVSTMARSAVSPESYDLEEVMAHSFAAALWRMLASGHVHPDPLCVPLLPTLELVMLGGSKSKKRRPTEPLSELLCEDAMGLVSQLIRSKESIQKLAAATGTMRGVLMFYRNKASAGEDDPDRSYESVVRRLSKVDRYGVLKGALREK